VYAASTALSRKATLQGYCFAAIRAVLQACTSGHTLAHRCNGIVIQVEGVKLPHLGLFDVRVLNGFDEFFHFFTGSTNCTPTAGLHIIVASVS